MNKVCFTLALSFLLSVLNVSANDSFNLKCFSPFSQDKVAYLVSISNGEVKKFEGLQDGFYQKELINSSSNEQGFYSVNKKIHVIEVKAYNAIFIKFIYDSSERYSQSSLFLGMRLGGLPLNAVVSFPETDQDSVFLNCQKSN